MVRNQKRVSLKDKELSKVLYKLFITGIKYIPVIITILYILNTALAFIGIDIPFISIIGGMSILTWLFLYIASFVFKYCKYHRLMLYYIALNDITNLIDYYINIPISTFNLMMFHSILLGIFILLILIRYVKYNKKTFSQNNR